VREEHLERLWRRAALLGVRMRSAEGTSVVVFHPGVRVAGGGPDFRDALIALDGRLLVGDVELERRGADFRLHGHHRNPAYSGLVLQVVASAPRAQELPSGAVAASARWPEGGESPAAGRAVCRWRAGGVSSQALPALLEQAGDERFHVKAAGFAEALTKDAPAEVLYQGMMAALGYSLNTERFRALARAVPLRALEERAGAAGEEQAAPALERMLLEASGLEALGNVSGWRSTGLRPANQPARRIAAAARLVARHAAAGLAQALRGAVEAERPERVLEDALVVRVAAETLLGAGRAREMAVNAVLPFFHAWGRGHAPALSARALEVYQRFPSLPPNEVTRRIERQLRLRAHGARQQQGLLHLDRAVCLGRRCEWCPGAPQASFRLGRTSRSGPAARPARRWW